MTCENAIESEVIPLDILCEIKRWVDLWLVERPAGEASHAPHHPSQVSPRVWPRMSRKPQPSGGSPRPPSVRPRTHWARGSGRPNTFRRVARTECSANSSTSQVVPDALWQPRRTCVPHWAAASRSRSTSHSTAPSTAVRVAGSVIAAYGTNGNPSSARQGCPHRGRPSAGGAVRPAPRGRSVAGGHAGKIAGATPRRCARTTPGSVPSARIGRRG